MKIKRLLYFIVPFVFMFVGCADDVTTKNSTYQTLYNKVSGSITSVMGISMPPDKYGISCYAIDGTTDLTIGTDITVTSIGGTDNGAKILINKEVLEISPINGTRGDPYIGQVNGGIPSGPIYSGETYTGNVSLKGAAVPQVLQAPVYDADGRLTNNEYELWITVYVNEYKGNIETSPEGWFQMFWGKLYTAPKPPDNGESACIGLVSNGTI